MPFVKIEQDCRVLGQGFSPGETPVEVDDTVAAALVKEKLAVVVEAPDSPAGGAPTGNALEGGDPAGGGASGQALLPLGNKEDENN